MKSIFKSFTAKASIIVALIAVLTALTLYGKESHSLMLSYSNLGLHDYQPTQEETAAYASDALIALLLGCSPILAVMILHRRRMAQLSIIVIELLILASALGASLGGDRKGCEDCALPFALSVLCAIAIPLGALLWVGIAGPVHRAEGDL